MKESACSYCYNVVQYPTYVKRNCALLLIKAMYCKLYSYCCIALSTMWKYASSYCISVLQYSSCAHLCNVAYNKQCCAKYKSKCCIAFRTEAVCVCLQLLLYHPSYDKRICALLFIDNKVAQNVNLSIALCYCINIVQCQLRETHLCIFA